MSDQFDTTICLCLGAHEVLRRLNVPADDIRFVPSIEDDGRVGLAFYGTILPVLACELPVEERAAAWERAREWWCAPNTPETELLRCYNTYAGAINRVELVMTVQALERAQRAVKL